MTTVIYVFFSCVVLTFAILLYVQYYNYKKTFKEINMDKMQNSGNELNYSIIQLVRSNTVLHHILKNNSSRHDDKSYLSSFKRFLDPTNVESIKRIKGNKPNV
ncbi:hypothetical protein FACS1894109_00420 [Spirochaetia bacterium]|nr:hypothetical protein FACS1894109_00420 [Spirochaetia bacterium]